MHVQAVHAVHACAGSACMYYFALIFYKSAASNKKSRVTYGDQLTVPGQVQGRPKSGSLSVGMG